MAQLLVTAAFWACIIPAFIREARLSRLLDSRGVPSLVHDLEEEQG